MKRLFLFCTKILSIFSGVYKLFSVNLSSYVSSPIPGITNLFCLQSEVVYFETALFLFYSILYSVIYLTFL